MKVPMIGFSTFAGALCRTSYKFNAMIHDPTGQLL